MLPGDAQRQEGADEDQLADLDTDVEHEQRGRNGGLRQADLLQRAGEAEAVQQAETEGDDPGRARGQAGPAVQAVQDLHRDEGDRQRDDGLDRRAGHLHPAERGGDQRDAVGDREGRDRRQDAFAAAHDQQQGQHEQQVVDAAEDVLDAEHQVAPGHFAAAHRRRYGETRPVDRQALDLRTAVEAHDAGDDVGDADRVALDRDFLPDQPAGNPHLPALVPGAVDFHHARLARDLGRLRQTHVGRQARAAAQRGDFPEHVVMRVRPLGDFQVGRPEHVGRGKGCDDGRAKQQQDGGQQPDHGRCPAPESALAFGSGASS